MRIVVIVCLLEMISGHISAQNVQADSLFRFSGLILVPSDSTGIPNAHILNLTKGTGTVSGRDGSFELSVRNADTIKFSCIGFEDRVIQVNHLLRKEDIMIFMKNDTILMNELLVHPFGPRRFFKYKFMDLKLPEKFDEYTINPSILRLEEGEGAVPQTGIIFGGPVQALYNVFNKTERTNRKLRKNRKKYMEYLVPEQGDSLVWPTVPK
jgi:hypothetical protein